MPPTAGSSRPPAGSRSSASGRRRGRPRRSRRAPRSSTATSDTTRVATAGRAAPRRASTPASDARDERDRASRAARAHRSADEPVLVELLDERRARDAEAPRGLALVAGSRPRTASAMMRALEGLDARAQRMARARIARRGRVVRRRRRRRSASERQSASVRRSSGASARSRATVFSSSRTLPGHACALQRLDERRLDLDRSHAVALGVLPDERAHERLDVLRALAQRRARGSARR